MTGHQPDQALGGYAVRATPESGDKVTRFSPFSAQAEAGNVLVLRGPWNEAWFSSPEGFPEAARDDDADSTSRAFNALLLPQPTTSTTTVTGLI
ncbi:phage terminase large subunit [Sinorhizobium meliloti]|uniref:phage terminase large subunit n=1 Tax=Rhizobium meliloti TaxID=382 RepID=UPI001F1F20BB|nr:phage terminase large subunit [Sinorhizobium meliloti]